MHTRRSILVFVLACLAIGNAGCLTMIAAPFQPEMGDVVVLTTTDADGVSVERVLTPIDDDGKLYLSANHWPRAWFRRAVANPDVRVKRGEETRDYRVVEITGDELAGIEERHEHPILVKIGMGFAPREFIRLDPR